MACAGAGAGAGAAPEGAGLVAGCLLDDVDVDGWAYARWYSVVEATILAS